MSADYLNILTRGLSSTLASTNIENGKLRFTTDTGELYLDIKETEEAAGDRIKISDIESGYTETGIFAIVSPLSNKIYISSDTHRAYVYNGTNWIDLANVKLSLASIANLDLPIWFSATTDTQPKYSSNITYNTSTEELKTTNVVASSTIKVGGMIITDTLNDDGATHTVDFSFATSTSGD